MIIIFSFGCIIGYLLTHVINWYLRKERVVEYHLKEKVGISILTGVLFGINYLVNGFSTLTLCSSFFISLLIILSFVDLRSFIIPNLINFTIFVFSILMVFYYNNNLWIDIVDFIGVIIFNIVLLLIVIIIYKIRKIEIIGFGDIKLLFSVGLLFGLTNFSYALVISSIIALFFEVIILGKKRTIIPYGPYLSFGFLVVWFLALI